MRPEIEQKLRKIKKISHILRVVCKAIMAVVVLELLIATVLLLAGRGGTIRYYNASFQVAAFTLSQRLLLLLMIGLTLALIAKGFYHLHHLFGNYSRGEIFTGESAAQIHQFGIACVLGGCVNVAWDFMPSGISAHPPHSFEVNPGFIVIGATIVAISWFMEMAAEMREENELTI